MNALRVVVVGLCFGLLRSCEYVNRCDSNDPCGNDKLHGEPNGLDNNGCRCYANASLQLLAACFSDEIKNVKPFKNDSGKEQMRLDLCTIVEHINAREKRYTGDKKVMDAVRRLTGRLNPGAAVGGCVEPFVSRLNEELKFLQDYNQTFIYCNEILRYNDKQGVTLESRDTHIEFNQKECLLMLECPYISFFKSTPEDNGIYLYYNDIDSSKDIDFSKDIEDYWNLADEKKWKFCTEFLDRRLKGGQNVWNGIDVRFTKLKKKLYPGNKFIVNGRGYGESKDLEYTLPYEGLRCCQKFDLVGFIVQPGWHVIAYIKREGTWYEANDGLIRWVSKKYIDEKLAKCCDGTGKIFRTMSVYEAKD